MADPGYLLLRTRACPVMDFGFTPEWAVSGFPDMSSGLLEGLLP